MKKLDGIVIFYEPDYTNKTIKEIGRTPVLSYSDALYVYSETPNPASQLITWESNSAEDRKQQEEIHNKNINDPEWLEDLFDQI